MAPLAKLVVWSIFHSRILKSCSAFLGSVSLARENLRELIFHKIRFSVATGEFNGDGDNADVIVGMPRGANLNGKVGHTSFRQNIINEKR